MNLRDYIDSHFPGLVLRPSLYHQWDHSIHFELAKELYQFKSGTDKLNAEYFEQAYQQTLSLFNEIFLPNDMIFLVTNVYQIKNYVRRSRRLKVYHHYIRNNHVRSHLKQEALPYMFDGEEDAEDNCTSQFSLQCRKQDIRYPLLLKAISHRDFRRLKPRLHNPYGLYEPDVFFINVTRNIIFYIYDDRGCEVIARDLETIRPLYDKYGDWIDEYCREEIDQRFKAI
ncbi:DUF3885 domain-containing protein [Robertmurraya massiliosenegalensis]|uniref:DUF3885 domain-containing protein n=1 Tax=Robertmurraya TaxID=2837507 RepID=UPI0039A6BAAF